MVKKQPKRGRSSLIKKVAKAEAKHYKRKTKSSVVKVKKAPALEPGCGYIKLKFEGTFDEKGMPINSVETAADVVNVDEKLFIRTLINFIMRVLTDLGDNNNCKKNLVMDFLAKIQKECLRELGLLDDIRNKLSDEFKDIFDDM